MARQAQEPGAGPAASREPFFLWCSIADTHVPLAPTAPYCYKYDSADIPPAKRRAGEFDDLPPHIAQIYARP